MRRNLDEGDRPSVLTEEQVRAVYRRIIACCLLAGLSIDDATDVAQSVFEWLLRTEKMGFALTTPWIDQVIRNFVKRLWRRRARRREVYERVEHDPTIGHVSRSNPDLRHSLDELLPQLRGRDRALVSMLWSGASFAEAARRVGYSPGSNHRVRARLRKRIEAAFHARISPQ